MYVNVPMEPSFRRVAGSRLHVLHDRERTELPRPYLTERRAIIFDIDGTLVDSNDAHAFAWVDALKASGVMIQYPRVRSLIGMEPDKMLPELAGITLTSAMGRRIHQARSEFFESRYLKTVRPFPRARDLVERTLNAGYVPAVISNSSHDHVDRLLMLAHVADLLKVRILSESSPTARPLSELMFFALRALGVTASSAIAVGATPHDIAAAQRAGVSAIALRCGGWDDHELAGAAAVYQDPAELLSRFDDSLLSERALKEN